MRYNRKTESFGGTRYSISGKKISFYKYIYIFVEI